MLFVCYPKCSTCKKAERWLEEHGILFEKRDIKEVNPSYDELKTWVSLSGLEVRRFFNTSGLLYKSMNLKERIPQMNDEEKLQLLETDGMLVKRPILVTEDKVLVGFQEKEWEEKLLKKNT